MRLLDYYFKLIPNQFIRFIMVGGLNTAFGLGVYCILIYIGLTYVWATLIAHILGVGFNFLTTGKFVFDDTDLRHIIRFSICYMATYLINIGINKAAQAILQANTYFSGCIATAITATCAYLIMKFYVYKKGL